VTSGIVSPPRPLYICAERKRPVASWLFRRATLFSGKEGFGHDGRFHSESYFDLEDLPQQVAMALTSEEYETLMDRLEEHQLRVFYTKSEIEFGFTTER
jgi:uncharacterized protein